MQMSKARVTRGLNPFYFRAGLLPVAIAEFIRLAGLNPFYFRAGLLPGLASGLASGLGLNPFYFRAGLLPTYKDSHAIVRLVLIPFISGLDCYADPLLSR